MRLSTRSTYGVRAMYNLALFNNEGPLSVLSISRREGISVQYLEQLLNTLKKSGLVKSIRGPKGGYVLARRPGDIRIGDIVKNLEGEIGPVNCLNTTNKKHCKNENDCTTKILWENLRLGIENVLNATTLEDLIIKKAKKRVSKKGHNNGKNLS